MDNLLSGLTEHVEGLARDACTAAIPAEAKINGRNYIVHPNTVELPVKLKFPDAITTSEPDAFARAVLSLAPVGQPTFVCIKNERTVMAITYCDDNGDEFARPLVGLGSRFSSWSESKLEQPLVVEDFIVAVRRMFVKTPQRDKLLELVSNIVTGDETVIADNGLAQSVTTKVGVLKVTKSTLAESYMLTPHDPFTGVDYDGTGEIECFVRIVPSGGKTTIRLIVIDGPQWQCAAEAALRDFITKALKAGDVNKRPIVIV